MSLLRSEKDNFDVNVWYVFATDGEISILDEAEDIPFIRRERTEGAEEEKFGSASDVPFNQVVNLVPYSETDLRKATFTFRRPSFDDMPLMLSSFANMDGSGNLSPGDVFEFSNRKLKLLFVKGKAQDQDGKELKIDATNLGKIPPVLGSAMAIKMTDVLNI